MLDEIQALLDELLSASQMYYHAGLESPLTDEEYDEKANYLQALVETTENVPDEVLEKVNDLLNAVASGTEIVTSESSRKVKHSHPMLSLAKAQKLDEVKDFLLKTKLAGADEKGWVLQAKLDGLAVSARYENGKLKQLVTRGNGEEGEDITHQLNFVQAGIRKIVGLPQQLQGDLANADIELRGEIFMTSTQFEFLNNEKRKQCEKINEKRMAINKQREKNNQFLTKMQKVKPVLLFDFDEVKLKTSRNATAGLLNQQTNSALESILKLETTYKNAKFDESAINQENWQKLLTFKEILA